MLNNIKQSVKRFFFAEEIPYGLAVIRICLPLILLITVIHRWPYARELYSAEGATAQMSVNLGFAANVPELSGNLCVWLFTLLAITLVTSSIGWCTRFSMAVSFILYTYFSMLDSLSTLTKYNVIADHLLMLMALSPCGKIWSIDAWLSTRGLSSDQKNRLNYTAPIWTQRLMQIMIATVYFGAGATKIQTPTFFNGDQMKFWMVTHLNYDHPLGEVMALFPGFLAFSGFIILIWELSFVFLVWRPGQRMFCLGLGVFFHLMTTLLLGLYIFPLVCFCAYISYLKTEDVLNFQRWWKQRVIQSSWAKIMHESWIELQSGFIKQFHRIPVIAWNPLMLGVIIPICCTSALMVEHKLDRFGLRRPEGRFHLKQLDAQQVSQMLTPTDKLRETDRIFSFNVGVMSVCDNVFDCRPRFKQGTTVLAQASLCPPHGDVYLECNLHTEQGAIISQTQRFVTREETRATFSYQMCENTQPGKYDLVLKCNGVEIERRRIEILPNGRAPKVFAVSALD
jgi:hypothetical protein